MWACASCCPQRAPPFSGVACTTAVRGLRSAPGARSEPAICSADNSMPKALPVKSTLPEVIITPVAQAPTALMMRPTSRVGLIARIRAQPAARSAAMTGAESALAAKTARAKCCCAERFTVSSTSSTSRRTQTAGNPNLVRSICLRRAPVGSESTRMTRATTMRRSSGRIRHVAPMSQR